MQAMKVKNDSSQTNAITGAASGLTETVSTAYSDSREFLHEVRVELKQVTWPGKDDVISTTGVVIATVFFFGVFLATVDWLVQLGVGRLFKMFGV